MADRPANADHTRRDFSSAVAVDRSARLVDPILIQAMVRTAGRRLGAGT